MSNGVTDRLAFAARLLWRRTTKIGAVVLAVLAGVQTLRGELPADVQPLFAIANYLPHIRWYWWVIAVLALLLGVAFETAFRLYRQATSKEALAGAELVAWADRCAEHIGPLITVSPHPTIKNQQHLAAIDPFIDIVVAFHNASPFDLKIRECEGRLQFQQFGQPLSRLPEVVRGEMLPRGELKQFVLRQWLSPDAASHIAANLGAGLSGGQLRCVFSYVTHRGADRTIGVGVGNQIYPPGSGWRMAAS